MRRAGRVSSRALCLALLAVLLPAAAGAQSIEGRISGTVLDGSGAPVPGATVTLVHEGTGLVRMVVTDRAGAYLATPLPVGGYSVSAQLAGFRKVVKKGWELVADGRLTVNFVLEPGLEEAIEVTAQAGEVLNTVSGEIARGVDQEQVQNLALNGRTYMELASLVPGAPLLNDDALGVMTGLGINTTINGSRGNASLLTVDGGFNMDSGSNNSQISNVGIDFIQEVNIKTANFSAEYGRNSGASINVVTRSGGNRFHGAGWEYNRDEDLDANNFFLKQRGIAKAPLQYNNFGYRFEGPLQKNKLFFFVGQEWRTIRRFADPVRRTLPTRAERRGDFSARSVVLRDPLTGLPFPGNRIPADRITADGRAIAAVYDAMEKLARSYEDRAAANNAIFQGDNPFDFRQDVLRLDYRAGEHHRVYGRFLRDDYDLVDPYGTFIGSDLPTIPTNRRRPGRNYQLGHTWLVNPRWTQELKLTASWNGQRVPPVGEVWKREAYGFQFPQLFSGGGRYEESIPAVTISGFTSFEGAARSLLSPTTDLALVDTVTCLRGSHAFKGGVSLIRNRKDQNGRSNYPGSVTFNPSGNPNSTGNAFADALLGNFRTYSEAESDPTGFFRYTQAEAFVLDNWKVGRRLSVEVGVRYLYHQPIYTQANNVANFDPARYDPARAVRLDPRTGNLVPGSGDPFNGLVRAGEGVPEEEAFRVPSAGLPRVAAVPAGAPRGLYPSRQALMPRVSFAWVPNDRARTAFRGGIGFYYDRPEGNLIYPLLNLPPYNGSAQFENGNLAAPSAGRASAVGALARIDAIDPELGLPHNLSWSLSVQRELPWGVFTEVAYVGAAGRDLLRQPDINAVPFDALRANRALPAAQRVNENTLRPYLGYSSIRMRLSDAESNYHALQLYAARRKGDLRWTVSYTLGKAQANASGNGDDLDVGEDPFGGLDYNYGPTSYDRRHIFVGTFTSFLPFFKGTRGLAGALLGGWEVSGKVRWQTGPYLTVNANTSIGGRRADYLGGPIALADAERGAERWFNTAAFGPAPEDRRGNSALGAVEGPGLYLWDASFRKKFKLRGEVALQVQADVFNVLNTVNFRNPSTNFSSQDFGTINAAGPPRTLQLGARVEFWSSAASRPRISSAVVRWRAISTSPARSTGMSRA
jgi:hypothetical protein